MTPLNRSFIVLRGIANSSRLIATLGQNAASKKIGRKAILKVNVPKACDTIITPEAPLALRLQGNLLFGVSRVYQHQSDYVYNDTKGALANMSTVMSISRAHNIDAEKGGRAQ